VRCSIAGGLFEDQGGEVGLEDLNDRDGLTLKAVDDRFDQSDWGQRPRGDIEVLAGESGFLGFADEESAYFNNRKGPCLVSDLAKVVLPLPGGPSKTIAQPDEIMLLWRMRYAGRKISFVWEDRGQW